jgi:S1-C subfamily serine protease
MKTWKIFAFTVVAMLALVISALAQCPGGKCPSGQCPGIPPSWNPSKPQYQAPQGDQSQYPAVVHVNFQYAGRTMAMGTGFIADRDVRVHTAVVITCAHGYKALMSIQIVTQDGQRLDSNVLCVDSVNDVCIVQISDPGITPMVIADHAPKIGDQVFMNGFAEGTRFMRTEGKVTGWFSPEENKSASNFVSTSCEVIQGCSGGPIVNSAGEVVATVTGQFDGCVGPCLAKTLQLLKVKTVY